VQTLLVRIRDRAWNKKNLSLCVTVLSHSPVKVMNHFSCNSTKNNRPNSFESCALHTGFPVVSRNFYMLSE
jgi:hypothetical protein